MDAFKSSLEPRGLEDSVPLKESGHKSLLRKNFILLHYFSLFKTSEGQTPNLYAPFYE